MGTVSGQFRSGYTCKAPRSWLFWTRFRGRCSSGQREQTVNLPPFGLRRFESFPPHMEVSVTACHGLVETFLCIGRQALFWNEHWRRLSRSAKKMVIPLDSSLNKRVIRRIRRLGPHPHRGRLVLAADGTIDLSFQGYDAGHIFREEPIPEKLICLVAPKDYPGRRAGLKTTPRTGLEAAFAKARRRHAADAILHRSSVLFETTRGNIFWIKDGVVYTPSLSVGCLPGIMRAWVIARLRRWGVRVREGCYEMEDLKCADAVFRTNALIGARPVREIAGLKKWGGRIHPLARRLHAEFRKFYLRRMSSAVLTLPSGPEEESW